MRYYLDTEFDERQATLISIGVVAQDGREFYAINDDYDWSHSSQWLLENVRPRLFAVDGDRILGAEDLAEAFSLFIGNDVEARLFGYKSAWDIVLVHRLYGGYESAMEQNANIPLVCFDLHQIACSIGVGPLKEMVKPFEPAHNALVDARWNKFVHEQIIVQYGREL